MPQISIIIPVLNEADIVAAAIEHAWQTDPHEVVVVDGGSDDDTLDVAAATGAQVVQSAPGRGVQQNAGARASKGNVLLFLHADCWLEPQGLDQISKALSDPDVSAGAFRQRIEADGFLYRWLESHNARRVQNRSLPYGDQGIFLKRELFVQLGGFPEVALMEDLLLMREVRRQTEVVLLPGPLHVSARRWQKYGVIRQSLRNRVLLIAERLGVPLDRLAEFYPRR